MQRTSPLLLGIIMVFSIFDISTLGSFTLAFGMPGGWEWVILLILGLLIFGRRLPEVGRSLGKGIVEFKKGIKGIEEEIDEESSRSGERRISDSARQELPRGGAAAGTQERNPYASVEQPSQQQQ